MASLGGYELILEIQIVLHLQTWALAFDLKQILETQWIIQWQYLLKSKNARSYDILFAKSHPQCQPLGSFPSFLTPAIDLDMFQESYYETE